MFFFGNGSLLSILFFIPAVLIALTLHEFSHAFAADRLGDPTPSAYGRLTLNPLRHLNLYGTLCLLLFGFGWANPVPINVYALRKPKRDMAIIAMAGPLSNIILSFLGAFLYLAFYRMHTLSALVNLPLLLSSVFYFLSYFFLVFHFLNLSLAIFNLLPIPPLDGSRLLPLILPRRANEWVARHERQIYLGLMIWILCGSFFARFLLSFSFIASNPILSVLVRIISFTGILSYLVNFLSELMISLLSLIPFLA